MFQEALRELRNGKNDHQIEKQFDEGDAATLIVLADSQQTGARREHVHPGSTVESLT